MGAERRAEMRGVREERLFVQVESENSAGETRADTLSCSTLDISATGLRLRLHQELDIGRVVKLWVEIKGCPGKFMLTGIVRWCCQLSDGITCGIELQESDDELNDMADWQDLFV